MTDQTSIVPSGAAPHASFDPGVFTFRSLQITEALAFGEMNRRVVSVFGEVFQRDKDKAAGMRRICSGRVEFSSGEASSDVVGRFSFPADMEVQPFLVAHVNVAAQDMQGLVETLRSGPRIELAFMATTEKALTDLVLANVSDDLSQREDYLIRNVSISVSR